MRMTNRFPHQSYDGYGVARLPYNDGAFDFFVVLPDKNVDINKVIDKFQFEDLLISDYHKLNVEMPKFEVENTNSELLDYLNQLNPNITFSGKEIHMLKENSVLKVNSSKKTIRQTA